MRLLHRGGRRGVERLRHVRPVPDSARWLLASEPDLGNNGSTSNDRQCPDRGDLTPHSVPFAGNDAHPLIHEIENGRRHIGWHNLAELETEARRHGKWFDF
jgi:hypothetical protein